jgi:selenocysteine-specific elongation factor
MHVVATAGHVDHGKSTLLRALTGMEPDRWEQERRRGLSIDLGFVWTELPDGQTLAFVDVPGHQRFVPNMLAGVGPVPAVMVVVAADQGWQPQSEEHLAALDALGVDAGLLVVTRADLADPAPVLAHARERLARSSLAGAEEVVTSGVTGEGLPALRAALGRLARRLPPPDRDADVRLWIDRSFSIRGAGTVVTGMLGVGTLHVGDRLALASADEPVTVRGIESLQRRHEEVGAVARVAVNLRGVDHRSVRRGDALLSPGRWRLTRVADARCGIGATDLPERAMLHAGSAAVSVRIRPLGADTARIRLARPLPLRIGDRALLRDPGRHLVLGGLVVLDPAPPDLRRRGAAVMRAEQLAAATGDPDADAEVRRRGAIRSDGLAALGVAHEPGSAVRIDGRAGAAGGQRWHVDPRRWQAWRRELATAVTGAGREAAADSGLTPAAVVRALRLPDTELVAPLARATDGVTVRDGRLVADDVPQLPTAVDQAVTQLLRTLERSPYAAPAREELERLGLDRKGLAAACRAGRLLRVADGVYLAAGSDRGAVGVLAGLPQPFTVSDARRALGSTRRVVVPLLEHLDARRLTRRLDANLREVVSVPGYSGESLDADSEDADAADADADSADEAVAADADTDAGTG